MMLRTPILCSIESGVPAPAPSDGSLKVNKSAAKQANRWSGLWGTSSKVGTPLVSFS